MILKLCTVSLLVFTLQTSVFAESPNKDVVVNAPEVESFQIPEAGLTIVYPKGASIGSKPHRMPDNTTGALVYIDFSLLYGDVWLQDIKIHSMESVSAFSKKQKSNGMGTKELLALLNELGRQKKEFQEQTGYEPVGEMKYRSNCRKAEPYDYYLNETITFVGNVRVTIAMGSKNECEKASEEFRKVLSGIRFNNQTSR